jgi:hypothetical protein
MPTARELLEQADALMRRNRKHGRGRLDGSTLTGVLEARGGVTVAPTVILPPAAPVDAGTIVLDGIDDRPPAGTPAEADAMPLDTLGDVPILTDVVRWPLDEEAAASSSNAGEPGEREPAVPPMGADEAFPASDAEAAALALRAPAIAVLEREIEPAADDVDPQKPAAGQIGDMTEAMLATDVRGSADAAAAQAFLDRDFILEIPPVEDVRDAAPLPAVTTSGAPGGDAAWQSLAEEVRMQVLQRLDLFTDTGLREQLGAHLSPIVARASAQLVETINRELGELVRGYVAEAIEREIESWRKRSGE